MQVEVPLFVSGDRVLLMQAIANLLENAIRHTPKGTRIWILAHGRQIGVADNGPGIPPEECRHVTQPLYRLERSRTTEGVGLGLSLVKTIANLHGAELLFSENPQLPIKAGLYVQIGMPYPPEWHLSGDTKDPSSLIHQHVRHPEAFLPQPSPSPQVFAWQVFL